MARSEARDWLQLFEWAAAGGKSRKVDPAEPGLQRPSKFRPPEGLFGRLLASQQDSPMYLKQA